MGAGEVQTGFKEKLFHKEGDQAVDQVAQRSCAVSIPGRFQSLIG